MVETQTLDEQLQRNADHDASGDREQQPVREVADLNIAPVRDLDDQHGDGRAEGLAEAAEQGRPHDGLGAAAERHVERQGHGEALGDVVHEQRHKDVEAELWVRVVRGVGDEALGDLVYGEGDYRLETYVHERVGGHVMVMRFLCFYVLVHWLA